MRYATWCALLLALASATHGLEHSARAQEDPPAVTPAKPDVSTSSDKAVPADPPRETTAQKLAQRLDVSTSVPLEQLLEFLRDSLDVQFYIRAQDEVDREAIVSLDLRQIRADAALELALQELSLTYAIRDELVVIGTLDHPPMEVRVYPLTSLLQPPLKSGDKESGATEESMGLGATGIMLMPPALPMPPSPGFSGSFAQFGGGLGGGGGESGMGMPGGMGLGGGMGMGPGMGGMTPDPESRVVHLVTTMVRPEFWSVQGGSGEIQAVRGQLFVRATGPVLREVETLLEQLK